MLSAANCRAASGGTSRNCSSLVQKLAGDFNIFDPFGGEDKKAAGAGAPMGPGVGGVGVPPAAGDKGVPMGPGKGDDKDGKDGEFKGPENLLVRFVDPTVEPGKT